ncbi:hypothetical protein, partial [Streptomyces albus]
AGHESEQGGEAPSQLPVGTMGRMAADMGMVFPLPPGATGFFRPQDGPLPETDRRAFRTALYAAARAAGGQVDEVEDRHCPRTYHTATVTRGAARTIVLCHAHQPWVAFAGARRDQYTDEFLAPPPWAGCFTAAGFAVLTPGQLAAPLSQVDASALTPAEWRQVRYHRATTLGGVLFNAWD